MVIDHLTHEIKGNVSRIPPFIQEFDWNEENFAKGVPTNKSSKSRWLST
ncbi:hypothetical protein [Oscillatoria sp. HE19RPO]|nr:hypothetical protein [Oscillatoria sp. HE19RPO]